LAFKPEDFPLFTPPDSATVKAWTDKLQRYLHNVGAALGIEKSDLIVNRSMIYEIFLRIEKRRVYFHIYHNGMEMGELNEGALLCFWILKLMPFQKKGVAASLLNTQVAYIAFVNLIHYVANKTKRRVNIKKELMDNLLYAFQYRDLSKEAIMALAESHLF